MSKHAKTPCPDGEVDKSHRQIVPSSSERWQSGLRSFADQIILNSNERRQKRRQAQALKNPVSAVERLLHSVKFRITSTRSTSKFHLNTFQYSIGGSVMIDAITYDQDCT